MIERAIEPEQPEVTIASSPEVDDLAISLRSQRAVRILRIWIASLLVAHVTTASRERRFGSVVLSFYEP
jgi:hypothetical protein